MLKIEIDKCKNGLLVTVVTEQIEKKQESPGPLTATEVSYGKTAFLHPFFSGPLNYDLKDQYIAKDLSEVRSIINGVIAMMEAVKK